MKGMDLKTVVLTLSVVLTGCTRPLLFNNGVFLHTVEPLTFNNNPTEVRESLKQARGTITQVTDPLSSALSIRVGKNGLGGVAKEHGIETVYYADIERWSALFGLWSRDVVHIYGR
jgi:hypothetical protein